MINDIAVLVNLLKVSRANPREFRAKTLNKIGGYYQGGTMIKLMNEKIVQKIRVEREPFEIDYHIGFTYKDEQGNRIIVQEYRDLPTKAHQNGYYGYQKVCVEYDSVTIKKIVQSKFNIYTLNFDLINQIIRDVRIMEENVIQLD